MENTKSKPRSSETRDQRDERLKKEADKALNDALAEQDLLDRMVRRSIETHGP
jgi:hypothetical protein